jgi:hypothetical protein
LSSFLLKCLLPAPPPKDKRLLAVIALQLGSNGKERAKQNLPVVIS